MIDERRGRKAPTVLLPLDGTPESHTAIPVAKAIAALTNTTLHIVYAAEGLLPLEEITRRLALTEGNLAGAVLDEVQGLPAEAIVDLANERLSLVIVMAAHSGPPLPGTGLGPVATEVVNTAPCPVLLVPPKHIGDTWDMGAVLLPQDGRPETAVAVEIVAHLVYRAGAELLVLHVSETEAAAPAEPGSLTIPRYLDQPQHEWPAWIGEFVDRIRGLANLPEGFQPRFFLGQGEPGSEIVRIAQEQSVDLIVLPWHESLAPERAAALKAVVRDAPCPVLILPFSKTRRLRALEQTAVERA